jgi:alanyl-tRNA synthetase
VLAANIGGKPSVAVGLADSLVTEKGMDAVSIVKKHIAVHIKGGGGGQKTLATAGGQEVSGMEKAIQEIRSILI